MSGKRFRKSLFGFNKDDVYNYICELDEKVDEKLKAKDKEISDLREKIDDLQSHREEIVSVLRTAEKNAKIIVAEAQKSADEMRNDAEREVNEKKGIINREIEIKRRAIKNYYITENKKIEQIKNEVERMRRASIEAIKRFEAELSEVERMSDNSSSYVNSAMGYAESASVPDGFSDVERSIPVHVVEPLKDWLG